MVKVKSYFCNNLSKFGFPHAAKFVFALHSWYTQERGKLLLGDLFTEN